MGLLAVAACGGDSASDKFPDDIDTDITLDQAGASGLNRICSTFEGWVRDQYSSSSLVEAVCTAQAIESTETAGDCADAVQECLDSPPAQAEALLDSILAQAGCSAIAVTAEGCASTVGKLEACLDALGDELDNVQLTLTCAAAGQPLDDGWYEIPLPAACAELQSDCGPAA
jgi:hypothetical protein